MPSLADELRALQINIKYDAINFIPVFINICTVASYENGQPELRRLMIFEHPLILA